MSVGGWLGSYNTRFKSGRGFCLNGMGTSLSLNEDDGKLDQLRGLGFYCNWQWVGAWKFTAMVCVT